MHIMETELEQILTCYNKARMISYMASHPEAFEEAIQLALADKKPYSWRAAWLLWSCMEENDPRIRRYVKRMVNALPDKDDSQLRELLIILRKMELDEASEGKLFNTCLTVWEQVYKSPSVRFNAFRMIIKIIAKHPELARELTFLTQQQYLETLSPAVKKALSKLLQGHL
jgi:hypothetical protein